MNTLKKAIVIDLDETLVHSYNKNNKSIMILRPNLDKLIEKLQEVKIQNIDIILCTTSKKEWVNRFFQLKPPFEMIFDKVFTRENEELWRNFKKENFPIEYNAKNKNINLEYLKPVTTFGYNQILYIDDNKLEGTRLKILFDLTNHTLNKDVTFFSGFKFFRRTIIWQELLKLEKGTSNNFKIAQYLEKYIEIERTNPGCEMMVSSINYFIKKDFKAGLTLLDERYIKEYSLYENKILKLQEKIQQIC